jgi:hypothetical protein
MLAELTEQMQDSAVTTAEPPPSAHDTVHTTVNAEVQTDPLPSKLALEHPIDKMGELQACESPPLSSRQKKLAGVPRLVPIGEDVFSPSCTIPTLPTKRKRPEDSSTPRGLPREFACPDVSSFSAAMRGCEGKSTSKEAKIDMNAIKKKTSMLYKASFGARVFSGSTKPQAKPLSQSLLDKLGKRCKTLTGGRTDAAHLLPADRNGSRLETRLKALGSDRFYESQGDDADHDHDHEKVDEQMKGHLAPEAAHKQAQDVPHDLTHELSKQYLPTYPRPRSRKQSLYFVSLIFS